MTTALRIRALFWLLSALVVGLMIMGALWYVGGHGQSVGYRPYDVPHIPREWEVPTKSIPDPKPSFQFDPAQPWQIDLGRGSGLDGLDTVKITADGWTEIHRSKTVRERDGDARRWEKASLTLPPDAVNRIAATVTTERVMELDRAYYADVHDGTQWVLCIRQGGREKVVYLDNHFPERVVRLAAIVDAELVALGDAVRWREVPWSEEGRHDEDLWGTLRK